MVVILMNAITCVTITLVQDKQAPVGLSTVIIPVQCSTIILATDVMPAVQAQPVKDSSRLVTVTAKASCVVCPATGMLMQEGLQLLEKLMPICKEACLI